MTEEERRKAAQGLIEAVKTNDAVHNHWASLDRDDVDGHAKWVQQSLNLPEKPSEDDLKAMHAYAKTELAPQIKEMRDARPEAPFVAGLCVAEGN